MSTYTDRHKQIEDLLGLIDKLELEPMESVKLETDLLIAYSLIRIESHLSKLVEGKLAGAKSDESPLAPESISN